MIRRANRAELNRQPDSEPKQRDLPILRLTAPLVPFGVDPGRLMPQHDGGLDFVSMLPSRSRTPRTALRTIPQQALRFERGRMTDVCMDVRHRQLRFEETQSVWMISIRPPDCYMDHISRRMFALIPAAGRSRRMGTSKLLLPWQSTTVIEHLIGTLTRPEIAAVVIVIRPDDHALQEAVQRTSAVAVIPDHEPPEMRDSIEIGLQAIRQRFSPADEDGWLLIPADHPLLEQELLDGLLTRWSQRDCEALLPTFGQQRGHPTLMRWSLAERIEQLPRDVGVNTLLRSSPNLVIEWPTDRESVLADLDTPEDYAFWRDRLENLR